MSLSPPENQDLVVFGATGNLGREKILPALYDLSVQGLLPREGEIIGCARRKITDDEFRELTRSAVKEHSRSAFDRSHWDEFAARLRYFSLAAYGPAPLRESTRPDCRLMYLALPPHLFEPTIRDLGEAGLAEGTRLVLEKPLGHDLASFRRLQDTIERYFREDQVFRIDHFLGKETVQNILVFRFGNALFEHVWHRQAIDHVQITVAESKGVDGRGEFYDGVGATRDIVQNHALQMLALLAMDRPAAFESGPIHDEKAKLLDAVRPVDPSKVVLGQYVGREVDGKRMRGYLEEPGVDSDSQTETFAAMRLAIENERWTGVPFYIRTGKRMPRRSTEVHVAFREAPQQLFDATESCEVSQDHLTMNIQPRESISLTFLAKVPGQSLAVQPVDMDFAYGSRFPESVPAYERLIHDVMCGDQTHFTRGDSVDHAWQVVEPLVKEQPEVCDYPAMTWGPAEADGLIAPRQWHLH